MLPEVSEISTLLDMQLLLNSRSVLTCLRLRTTLSHQCTVRSVSSLLERLSNAACEDDPEACKDALRGVRRVSQDFELIRPILDTLILQPRGTWTRDSGELSRHLSAPPLHPATVSV
jgi:hypothetical protein